MPGEAVPTDAAADEKFAEEDKYYKQYWETRVLQKTASKDKWAEWKGQPIGAVVKALMHSHAQSGLWHERSKLAEGMIAADYITNECILLMRFVELCGFLLQPPADIPQHPEQIEPANKKTLKANYLSACERVEQSKKRLKQLVGSAYREKLRKHAVANTKAVGDALISGGGGNSGDTKFIGDAILRESLANLPGSNSSPQMGNSMPYESLSLRTGAAMVGPPRFGDDDDDVFIAVPADDGDVPNLLPEQNRMTWNTFMQHQRPAPGQIPHWRAQPLAAPSFPISAVSGSAQPPAQYLPSGYTQPPTSRGGVGVGGVGMDPFDAQLQEAIRLSQQVAHRENEKTVRLKERLEKYTEYELEEVDNTGHCQFDALAHQISGRFARAYPEHMKGASIYHYRQVRRDIASWLRQNAKVSLDNGESISDFLDEDDGATWEIFCDNVEDVHMKSGPLWGNHLTLIAAANCYQRPIRVWSTAPGDDWWLQIEPKHYKASTHNIRPFELAHLYERHYLSVTERKGPKRGGSMHTTPF